MATSNIEDEPTFAAKCPNNLPATKRAICCKRPQTTFQGIFLCKTCKACHMHQRSFHHQLCRASVFLSQWDIVTPKFAPRPSRESQWPGKFNSWHASHLCALLCSRETTKNTRKCKNQHLSNVNYIQKTTSTKMNVQLILPMQNKNIGGSVRLLF